MFRIRREEDIQLAEREHRQHTNLVWVEPAAAQKPRPVSQTQLFLLLRLIGRPKHLSEEPRIVFESCCYTKEEDVMDSEFSLPAIKA